MAFIEIDLERIKYNSSYLVEMYRSKNIDIIGVTKGFCGDPKIAKVLLESGISELADSRLENILKMKLAGVKAKFHLSRPPLLSQVEEVVLHTDVSFNSEISVIRILSNLAVKYQRTHQVILLVELGDLRDGIMPNEVINMTSKVLPLPGIELVGIATNLACLNGATPSDERMNALAKLAEEINEKYQLSLEYVSGGNSANYSWFLEQHFNISINNLRIGESILLGNDPLQGSAIQNLFRDAFTLKAEVIEVKTKPAHWFNNETKSNRAVLGIGLQDVPVSGLEPHENITILGISSDHLVIDPKDTKLAIGDKIAFNVNYAGLLSAMTSPYIRKIYKNDAPN